MTPYFAILEDNAERADAMRKAAAVLLPDARVYIADDAQVMNAWLDEHLGETIAISLDHDLPVSRAADGSLHDHGDGMQVTRHLAHLDPMCPVIVHTSNTQAGGTMVDELKEHGWLVERVRPFDSASWVDGDWRDALSALMARGLVPV